MVDPDRLDEETDLFIAGNDAAAKSWVTEHVLEGCLGWSRIVDLGDITAARATEMYLPLWLRLMGATGTPLLNVKLVVAR
jgi:predicted dinucleotide-binding enzyme